MNAIEAIETLGKTEMVDLTHTLEEGIPVWPTHARFGHTLYESYELGDEACHYGLTLGEHTGTHVDAPLHFIPDGDAHYGIDEIPLEQVVGRAATIDASHLEPREVLSANRIRKWEADHEEIATGDSVLIRFGWGERWDTGQAGRRFLDDWPGLSSEAASLLVERGVDLVGTDALSIDATGVDGSPAHHALLGTETYIAENLANLESLPPFSAFAAFPLKIANGSGSPVRAVAFVDNP